MLSAILKSGYSLASFLLAGFLYPFFLLHGRGRLKLAERYGKWNLPTAKYIWLHGASMGEVNGLLPIIEGLRAAKPNTKLLLTSTSVTGLEKAAGLVDEAHLLPFDSAVFLERAVGRAEIRALIITEKEHWPGLIAYLSGRKVRMFLVNAAISDDSFRRFQVLGKISAKLFSQFRLILCASQLSAERFLALGVEPKGVAVTGNSKYDIKPSVPSIEVAMKLRSEAFMHSGAVLILGSLRPGEEDVWFPAVQEALNSGMALNVIVAPRHPEKFSFFAARLDEYLLPFSPWSKGESGTARVLLLDTLGKLEAMYSFADLAFIGGSIVDWGGHNPLEAACYGACPVMGPHYRNALTIVEDLRAKGALILVNSIEEARSLLRRLNDNLAEIKRMGERAKEVSLTHRGAAGRIVERIVKELGKCE